MRKLNNKKIAPFLAILLLFLVASIVAYLTMEKLEVQPGVGGGPGTINQLEQWKSDGTNITQTVPNKPIKITGLSTGDCLTLNGSSVLTTTTCGAGGSSTTTINGVSGPAFTFASGTATGIGLTISTSTGTITFTPTVSSGYVIPLSASTSEWTTSRNIVTASSTLWDTAYSWGNHATFGYLTGISWGAITGTLSNQTDLQSALNAKQDTLTTGNLTENIAGLEFNATRQVIGGAAQLSLTSGYTIPLSASTTEWTAAYASTTALTPAYIRGLFSNTATGLSFNSGTGATSLAAGYVIPLSASTSEWANFHTTPSGRITAGDVLTWSGNTLNFDGGANPAGDLGGTWASPSVDDDSHAHTGATLSGIDISDDTNLTAGNNITLTGDNLDVDDAFLLNTGDTGTGNYSFSGLLTNTGTTTLATTTIGGVFTFGGVAGSAWTDFCTTITGGAGLCDGSDDGGGGGGGLGSTTPWTAGQLAVVATDGLVKSVATSTLSENISGLEFDANPWIVGSARTLSLSSGYVIPLTASTTEWYNFHTTPSGRITAGTNLSWSGNTLNVDDPFSVTDLSATNATTSALVVTGATTLSSTLDVTGQTTLVNASSTNLTVSGNSYLGTVQSGTWNGSTIGVSYGGTGATTLTGLVVGNGTSAMTATTTSAGLAAVLSNETGTGSVVFSTSPTLTTPAIANIRGGTAVSSTLTLRSTSGVGTSDAIILQTGNSVERMRITTTGDIGIGTSTPSAKLQITGTAGSGDIFAIASSTNTSIFTVTAAGNVGIGTTTPAARLQVTGVAGTNPFRVASSSNTSLFEITQLGRVGIGSSSPSHTLTVAGNLNVTGASRISIPRSFTWPGVATTTSATSTVPLGIAMSAEAWTSARCKTTSGTAAWLFKDDAGNRMNGGFASTTSTSTLVTLSTNNTFTTGEGRNMDIGPLTNAMITCSVDVTINN